LFLRTIDGKVSYEAQLHGAYGGFVQFKEPPAHWIFSDNKKDMSKEIMSMSQVKEKFKYVTG
jgi:hypothetical protein